MRAAAKLFVGKHDFQSFAANPGYKKESTVRRLTRCDVKKSGAQFTFIIEGDGFLYKMCRGIVGTIVQCRPRQISAGGNRNDAGEKGPPRGRHDRAGARAGAVEGFL